MVADKTIAEATSGGQLPEDGDTPGNDPHGRVIVPRRWRSLAALTGAFWADNNETSVLTTLSPVIISALALPASALGLLVSVSKGIGVVFGPVWSWLARRTNRKTCLVVSTACVSAASAATGLAQNFGQLLALWSLAAVFVAAALPIVTEITADLFDERSRGRANGYTWGAIGLLGAALGPAIGQLARVPEGWRIGFFITGGIGVLVTLGIVLGLRDPGVGASEPALRRESASERAAENKLTWAKVKSLARIPSFLLILGQRLFSGHLLITTFGVLFLVETYGFSTAVAAIVTLPFGIGYLVGRFGGGLITDRLHARSPKYGRVVILQSAQIGFAIAALIGTQFAWGSIGIFAAFWGLMGLMQGVNPGVNRPIVTAVVPPELRGAAFALMLSVFEALAFIGFNLAAGFLSETVGLKTVMLWIPGVLMVLNGLYCTLLYRTYPRDSARLTALLNDRAA